MNEMKNSIHKWAWNLATTCDPELLNIVFRSSRFSDCVEMSLCHFGLIESIFPHIKKKH